MSEGVHALNTGDRIWIDGSLARIAELSGQRSLVQFDSGPRSMSTAYLAANASPLEQPLKPSAPANQALTNLTEKQKETLRSRLAAVDAVADLQRTTDDSVEKCTESVALTYGLSARTLQRWFRAFERSGPAGLVDARKRNTAVDPDWKAACNDVLNRYTRASTPSRNVVIDQIAQLLAEHYGDSAPIPSTATAYRWLEELSKGRHAFGSGKARRSVANRPDGPYGRLHPTRPGEFVVLDTTRLDVFAMEPVTLRWVPVELTVAQDLYTRCIVGLRLTPVSTNSGDVANVLHQAITPQEPTDGGGWPFHGVPRNVVIESQTTTVDATKLASVPGCLPETIVVDHGKVYLSHHITSACARLGISIQPATPYKPTDKPTIERFFRTLRLGLLQHLPAYKGPDVYNRGDNIEEQSFYYVTELERIIREWVAKVYHRTKHQGLCVPEVPGAELSPLEMYEIGIARSGGLLVPATADLAYEFLDVRWRTIQHYGVEVDGRRYDGSALNPYRNTRSEYGGGHAGKWPIHVDVSDVRRVHFRDPVSREWSQLRWEHGEGLAQPFSADAAAYTKRLALTQNRHVDPSQAVADLLVDWSRDLVTSRRDRALAKRLASSRHTSAPDEVVEGENSESLPGVIDLLTARTRRDKPGWDLDDDLDVFEEYEDLDGSNATYEVFDE